MPNQSHDQETTLSDSDLEQASGGLRPPDFCIPPFPRRPLPRWPLPRPLPRPLPFPDPRTA